MSLVESAVVAWALLAAGFSLVALWRLRRAAPPQPATAWPPVLLLRPMDAPSGAELEGLAAPVDYPGPLEQVVLSPFRPPLPAGVRWLPSDPVTGNRKVGHLLYGHWALGGAGRAVVSVDGDVRVDGNLVRALVAPLVGGADLTWAAPQPQGAQSVWGHAVRGLLGRGHHAFDALQAMPAGAPAVCGKALGLGPAALELLPEVADCIGEDLELAARLAARGGRVQVASAFARMTAERGSRAATVDRFTRWMQVLRAHRPALYPSIPALFAPTLPLLLAAGFVATPAAAGAVLLLVLARSALSVQLARRAGAGLAGAAWEWLLGEGLLLESFLRSLFRRKVAWRGRTFRLERGGRMRELLTPASPWSAS